MASISGYDRSNVTIETEDLDKGGIRDVVAVPNGRILVYLQPFADGSPVLHLTPDQAVTDNGTRDGCLDHRAAHTSQSNNPTAVSPTRSRKVNSPSWRGPCGSRSPQ